MSSVTAANPLDRINLAQSPNDLIKGILKEYGIKNFENYELITEKGMVEVNFKVNTFQDTYVVKIFSNKELQRAEEIISAQQAFYAKGIPFPKVYNSTSNKPYFVTHSKEGKPFYGCVISWLDGNDFTDNDPTPQDLKQIAKYLAMINDTKLKITQTYDDCFPINLSKEYERRKKFVEPEALPLIEEVIHEMKKVNLKN